MDGDWKEVARLSHPPPISTRITTIAFDSSQELLWNGNEYGRVISFYSRAMRQHTSFNAHPPTEGAVHQILCHDKGVIALGSRSVHMALRRGLPLWHITNNDFKDLRCMAFVSKTEILVAGLQDQMFVIDVIKGEITRQVQTSEEYTIMKRCRYVCAATKTGSIDIMDPNSFKVIKRWSAHASAINDMDAQHDFIVTCGSSVRQGRNMLDPLVNVFDLKQMIPVSPVPFPAGAAHVRIHPKMSTTSIVASATGQIHVVDLVNPNTSNVRQAPLNYLTKIEIAPSGEALAIITDTSDIQLWGSPARLRFAEIANPMEFASTEEIPALSNWEAPLNSIGMPHYREQLLSAWPTHQVYEVGAPPVQLDLQWVSRLMPAEIGVFGPNQKSGRPNQIQNTRMTEKTARGLQTPKFLSEKARDSVKQSLNERRISDAEALGSAGILSKQSEVPAVYQRIDIKYSKFGVDDFDFGHYNKTEYSGLETHIPNCYANPLLQILHSIPLLRNFALQHTAMNCTNDPCLLCELGFLFDMLEKAEGSICQATNLLKTLNHHSQAMTLRLLEEESQDVPSTNMLQSLARFLLDSVVQDHHNIEPHSTALNQILAMHTTESLICTSCRNEHSKMVPITINNLTYPLTNTTTRNARTPPVSFSQVLKASLDRDGTDKQLRYCNKCIGYRTLHIRRIIHNPPNVLMLNAAVINPETRRLWATPGWLPEEIGIIIDQGQVFCYEGKDLETHLQRGMHNITVYSLIGFAADIESGPHQKSHLVSLINVAHSNRSPQSESKWHLFNDFLVRPVLQEEALTFNAAWKLPSVIAYQTKPASNFIDDSWKQKIDTSLLYQDHSSKKNIVKTYSPLDVSEAPGPGTIVAIDTEFVSVKQSEVEMNADGESQMIRPVVYALARVSVVRGMGTKEGVPLIDDYIASKEKIYDYLTAWSGIQEGDLDPHVSRHKVVSLKMAYKKLWILLNLGCSFLGHSLKMDIRVTNIHIPKSQIIDTSELFFIEQKKRKLGLAFLAWFLLKEDIQVGTHDSIVDARTALKLYRKYLEYLDAGVLRQMLEDIYATGEKVKFKPPLAAKDGGSIERTETPPIPPQQHMQGGDSSKPTPTTPVKKVGGMRSANGALLTISNMSSSPLR